MNIKKKFSATICNFFLFLLFIMLIGHAAKRMNQFIVLQKQSYIHELDSTFIDYLHTAQQQLQKTKKISCLKEKDYMRCEEKLNTLQKNLSWIEEKYRKNSPGLALLGPIGTIAIILKEKKLAQQLHKAVHEIGIILHSYLESTKTFDTLLPSIQVNLHANKAMIKQLYNQ